MLQVIQTLTPVAKCTLNIHIVINIQLDFLVKLSYLVTVDVIFKYQFLLCIIIRHA